MNLEIQPEGGSSYVLRGGEPIARFNCVEVAEAFVLAELLNLTPAVPAEAETRPRSAAKDTLAANG